MQALHFFLSQFYSESSLLHCFTLHSRFLSPHLIVKSFFILQGLNLPTFESE